MSRTRLRCVNGGGYDSTFDIEDRMVHSIHVYEGDADFASGGCTALTADQFCEATSLEEVDAIDCAVPDNWLIEARYTYSDGGFAAGVGSCPINDLYSPSIQVSLPMELLKTTVTRRDETDPDRSEERHGLYRYDDGGIMTPNGSRSLKAVFDSSTVDAVLAANPDESANGLLGMPDTAGLAVVDAETGETHSYPLIELADLEFE